MEKEKLQNRRDVPKDNPEQVQGLKTKCVLSSKMSCYCPSHHPMGST